MASRSTSYLKSIANRLRGSAAYTTATTPKAKAFGQTADLANLHSHQQSKRLPFKGDFVPVYVSLGMIGLSVTLGLHTAKQQLFYSPTVRVSKKTRETLPEVEDPDKLLDQACKFVKKSLFRKVAHVQEHNEGDVAALDPICADPLTLKTHTETLKTVGVDPKQH